MDSEPGGKLGKGLGAKLRLGVGGDDRRGADTGAHVPVGSHTEQRGLTGAAAGRVGGLPHCRGQTVGEGELVLADVLTDDFKFLKLPVARPGEVGEGRPGPAPGVSVEDEADRVVLERQYLRHDLRFLRG
jgi:hypothetical protein